MEAADNLAAASDAAMLGQVIRKRWRAETLFAIGVLLVAASGGDLPNASIPGILGVSGLVLVLLAIDGWHAAGLTIVTIRARMAAREEAYRRRRLATAQADAARPAAAPASATGQPDYSKRIAALLAQAQSGHEPDRAG